MTLHTATQLSVKNDTFIKQFPVEDSTHLPTNQKHFLKSGESLAIKSYKDDSSFNNHYEIELVKPINTFVFWYAYVPHVTIS